MGQSPDPNVELVSENIFEFARDLKNQTGKAIYLCGGADLAASLLKEDLIDEIVLKCNPVLFGSGVPLFSGTLKQTDLGLIGNKGYDNGVLLLYYRVKN